MGASITITMMEKVLLVLLLLDLTIEADSERKCSETVPLTCMNNANIRISQDSKTNQMAE